MLSIYDANYFVPNNVVDVDKDRDVLGITAQEAMVFKKICCMEKIHTAKQMDADNMIGLITQPIVTLLERNPSLYSEVKYIIHAHTINFLTTFGSSIIRQIKNNIGLRCAEAFAVSMSKCTSIFKAFELAEILLANAAPNDKAIIVTGEIALSNRYRIQEGIIMVGDASAAVLVGKNGDHNKLLSVFVGSNGKYSKGTWLSKEEMSALSTDLPILINEVIDNVLQKSGTKKEEIKLLLPHNSAMSLWRQYSKIIGIPLNKIYLDSLCHYGHCYGADIIINYVDAVMNSKKLTSDDIYMMVATGNGGYAGAALFMY